MRPFARLALALCAPMLAPASTPLAAPTDRPNGDCVRVTVEIGRSDPAGKATTHAYELVGAVGTRIRLSNDRRLPLPAAPKETTGSEAPSASYAYHGVGVKLELEVARQDADRYRVVGRLEASVLRTGEGEAVAAVPPVIGSFSSELDVVARPGKQMRVVTASEPPTGQVFVNLKVEPVD